MLVRGAEATDPFPTARGGHFNISSLEYREGQVLVLLIQGWGGPAGFNNKKTEQIDWEVGEPLAGTAFQHILRTSLSVAG